jgi:hypothetical protein
MPKDHKGWVEHYKKQIETLEGLSRLRVDFHLNRTYSPAAAEEVLMKYEDRQAQKAAKKQERQEEETLKAARRDNYIAWFAAMGVLLSGFTALAFFFESFR